MTQNIDPDCKVGKHNACIGSTWDDIISRSVPCQCACHVYNFTERDCEHNALVKISGQWLCSHCGERFDTKLIEGALDEPPC